MASVTSRHSLTLLVAFVAALFLAASVGVASRPGPAKPKKPDADAPMVPTPMPPPAPKEVPEGEDERPGQPLPTIDPKTPVKELLPVAPKAKRAPVYLGDDLSRVPELSFEAAPEKELTTEQWQKRKGHIAAAALHLNAKRQDGFLKELLRERADLSGVPFVMGDDCRTTGARVELFKTLAEATRKEMASRAGTDLAARMLVLTEEALANTNDDDKELRDAALHAHVAASSQILGPAPAENRLGLVKFLSAVPRVEATRELARVAIFSPQKSVREAAIEALAVRRERDYTAVLVAALRYPWPGVAANAAEAIVKLERKDLLPQLVAVLDGPDPRGPRTEEVDGKKATVARELVRINHHKNCLMCHAPAEPNKGPKDVLIAEVPLPSEELVPPEQGYNRSGSNLLVRLDVTYLRQDFSQMQAVKDAGRWPAMQRFDFVVRKRPLTDEEAADLKERLGKREPGELSPYHRAAVRALRDLTGRDFEARPEPWRKLLKLTKE